MTIYNHYKNISRFMAGIGVLAIFIVVAGSLLSGVGTYGILWRIAQVLLPYIGVCFLVLKGWSVWEELRSSNTTQQRWR